MSKWRKYPNLRAWIVGRISFHSEQSLPASRLAKPPAYILASDLDVDDALRELRNAGVIGAISRRWYIRNLRAPRKIGKPLPDRVKVANDA